MWIKKEYSIVSIALIVVELFQGKTNFGKFWGRDWILTEHMEAPESRWEHNFGKSSKIVLSYVYEWILTQLVNAQESK